MYKENYDSVVIGRGPLGIYTSNKLIKKGQKVLNIDSGIGLKFLRNQIVLKSNIKWNDVEQKPSLNIRASKYHWTGACMSWPKDLFQNGVGQNKIPIKYEEMETSINNVATELKLENFNFALNKPLYEIDNSTNSENFEMLYAIITKDLFFKNLFEFCNSSRNYTFLDNHIVEHIEPLEESIRISLTNYENKKNVDLTASNLFLCLGSIENTRTLLKSVQYLDINLEYLGKNLTDHVSAKVADIHTPNIKNFKSQFHYMDETDNSKLWPRLSYKKKNLAHSFIYADSFHTRKGLKKIKNIIDKKSNKAQLNIFFEKEPRESSFLELSKVNKEKLEVNFVFEESELESLKLIKNEYISFLEDNYKNIYIDEKKEFNRSPMSYIESTNHPCGTTRMSEDKASGVVNKYSQLWNHENIFIYGTSVLTRATNIHPTFASMTLADFSIENI